MSVYKITAAEDEMMVLLPSEIDHHIAAKIRTEIDIRLEQSLPKRVILDFSQVNFMDSSGIGFIIGRYKLVNEYGGDIYIVNPSDRIRKLIELSGVSRLAKIS